MSWTAQDKRGKPARPGRLKGRKWPRFLRGPNPELLSRLYEPALKQGIRYDRCCSFFSSSVLSAAAAGFAALTKRLLGMGDAAPRPAVRLLVNEELPAADVAALQERSDARALERLLRKRFKDPKDAFQLGRLKMLAWLYKSGLLDIRVGVIRAGDGIVHPKFGVITDEQGDSVVFRGSGNETAAGLAANYEEFEVSTSWRDPVARAYYTRQFEQLWEDRDPVVHTVTLPEAIRQKLLKLAPDEPVLAEPTIGPDRLKAAMLWRFICAAPYLKNGGEACDATMPVALWPHQVKVVLDTSRAWPAGRLLCDEVGMGKTLEAIGAIRRLMAGRGVRRVLLLVPAGLLTQWQGELREKGGLVVPRYDNDRLNWPDGREERMELADALNLPFLLVSRELARLDRQLQVVLAGEPWDLVVMDEAHAARRAEAKPGEFNSPNLLLRLLRMLQMSGRARGLMLLSATPMQIHPWEPWDLLTVLGVGGLWASEFSWVQEFYGALADLKHPTRLVEPLRADKAVALMRESAGREAAVPASLELQGAVGSRRQELVRSMRSASPLVQRMHRNSRDTLREYYRLKLLDRQPPVREVQDVPFEYLEDVEREVYTAVGSYIDARFATLENDKPGKGFVMTIYRRRASSSPQALRESLRRRQKGLDRLQRKLAASEMLAPEESADELDLDELEGLEGGRVPAGYPDSPTEIAAELAEIGRLLGRLVGLGNTDSKRDRFSEILRGLLAEGRKVLVFTSYTDTVDYVREFLRQQYGAKVGSYTGRGGDTWNGNGWQRCSKEEITRALSGDRLQVLVCNDAASEGLNLQAASAVVNYDLPWNPSRVEQRIGRVDRIGQSQDVVKVANLLLKGSVDERVYSLLRQRCGLFEHFVGAMQPVLTLARDILLGRPTRNFDELAPTVAAMSQDPFANDYYQAGPAEAVKTDAPLTRADINDALAALKPGLPVEAAADGRLTRLEFKGERRRKDRTAVVAVDPEVLADRLDALPLVPEADVCQRIAGSLARESELLPLVVVTQADADGRFRAASARWIEGETKIPVTSYVQLRTLVDGWDGSHPPPAARKAAAVEAGNEAAAKAYAMALGAKEVAESQLGAQREAARLRLLLELGRFLAGLQGNASNLNRAFARYLGQDDATSRRLMRAYELLGGEYPEWPGIVLAEVRRFSDGLNEGRRVALRAGKELDAAMDDPRWKLRER